MGGSSRTFTGRRLIGAPLAIAALAALGITAVWFGVAAGRELPVQAAAAPLASPPPALAEAGRDEPRREGKPRDAGVEREKAGEGKGREIASARKGGVERRQRSVPVARERKRDVAPTRRGGRNAARAAIPVPASTDMWLTVPKMGRYNDYVANSVDDATLHNGAGHAPFTGFPWQRRANVYIAAHVLGYPGTGSYLQFAALPSMTYGDEIHLTDANGTTYTYRVTEILRVSIYDTWVMNPTGKDMISLQTCINPPAYDVRLIVRGERVSVDPA